MSATETLEAFYRQKFNFVPEGLQKDLGHFNCFTLEDCRSPVSYSRRDFYKISLMRGRHIYHYADKSIEVNGSTLLFFNPQVPYTFQALTENPTGHFCIFKEGFFSEHLRGNLRDLPMYALGGKPAFILDETADREMSGIFKKMQAEMKSDYPFKFDLIRNYLMEIIHGALKLQPSDTLYQHPDANARIASLFAELLERQFPIENPSQQFNMRSARDYAEQLYVHTNHLNRAIRKVTGKTTSQHIAERLVIEAKALLRHTDWNIAEISYCLGFEEPSHFTNFFKKNANLTPLAWRTTAARD
jgi:AraC family transcriptional regulator, transcriptional activator of pobA